MVQLSDTEGLSQRLKELRKSNRLSQSALAELTGVSFMTIRRWESGEVIPRISEIRQLCEVLGCTESELLNGQSPDEWELRILVNKKGVETVDMTTSKSSAVLNVSDEAMAITLSAGYELWEDDAKFEELIEDLRRKRKIGLRTRKEDW